MTLALLLVGCAYEVPTDPDAPDALNVLRGTVVVSGPEKAADTIMVLYNADYPPPPGGTGRPVSFATIPAAAFTSAGADGVRSAAWALTNVPDGHWLVSALVDTDGNFNPITTSNSGSTCGDWSGAYYTDATSYVPAVISVSGGELLDGLTVSVEREVPIQRPAFEIVVDDTTDATIPFGFSAFKLQSIGIHSEVYDLEGPYDGTDQCDTAFWLYTTDADGDGAADAHPNATFAASGAKDYWPRVYLRYTDDTLPPGEFYGSEAISGAALFGGGLHDTEAPYGPLLNTPVPATTYDVSFPGAAVYVYADGTQESVTDPAQIPRGEWSVTVVQYTGQLWALPNVLIDYDATDESFDPATQGLSLTIE
ncbi:MAG: hypothetical protein Q8P41_05200 [Pseudomonadota bacterium]|nr:hypothetical protein [Pseudomonadota bacterium]